MEENSTWKFSIRPRDLCHFEFLQCSFPSVCYLNRSFSSSLGCFCSIIYATSFGNSSLCLKRRPRHLRLLVLLLEAVQILCNSSFLFHRCVFEQGPKTSFLKAFITRNYPKADGSFDLCLNLVTFALLKTWNVRQIRRQPVVNTQVLDPDDRLWKSEQSATQLHAIKQPQDNLSPRKALKIHCTVNPASVLKQRSGFSTTAAGSSELYMDGSRRCCCFVLNLFVFCMVPF